MVVLLKFNNYATKALKHKDARSFSLGKFGDFVT